jgi:hypothetical protein
MSDEAKKVIGDDEVQELLESLDESDAKSSHGKRILEASVVPIGKPVKRGKGRPKKSYGAPAPTDIEFNQAVIEQQVAFVEKDEIVKAIMDREDAPSMLHMLKERIARSAAALEFIRLEQQKRGQYHREVPQIVSRQIAALKEIANIELEIRKMGTDSLDLSNPRLQEVFKLLIDTFRDVAKNMLPPKEFDLVWNKLENELEGWEEKADSLIR